MGNLEAGREDTRIGGEQELTSSTIIQIRDELRTELLAELHDQSTAPWRSRSGLSGLVAALAMILLVFGIVGVVGPNTADAHHVPEADLAEQSVRAKHIHDRAVNSKNLKGNTISSAHILDGSVRAPDLGDLQRRQNQVAVPAGTTVVGSSICDPGEVAIGGGGFWSGTPTNAEAANLHVVYATPSGSLNPDRWTMRLYNGNAADWTFNVAALCLGD